MDAFPPAFSNLPAAVFPLSALLGSFPITHALASTKFMPQLTVDTLSYAMTMVA